jgi:hypothetical protein
MVPTRRYREFWRAECFDFDPVHRPYTPYDMCAKCAMYALHQTHRSAKIPLMPTSSAKAGKVSVSARVPAEVAAELDRMASGIRPKPTRSQMVSMALQDWLKSKPVLRARAKGMP